MNAKYAFDMLGFYYLNFASTTRIPEPIAIEDGSVFLEYIPELVTAKLLDAKSITASTVFFERCYMIQEDLDVLRSIRDSVCYNDLIQKWLESGRPISLGLKGDLWQNLCIHESHLILADIDSTAIEPLGFSEVVMHAEIHAELSTNNLVHTLFTKPLRPNCFERLSKTECGELIEMALYFVSLRMAHLPSFVRQAKLRLAGAALRATV